MLFAIAGIAAIGLLTGYYARLCTFISWMLLLSLQNRNPLILQGGDDLLRLMLFWGIFLPWHQRYSFDEIRLKKSGKWMQHSLYSGVAVIGYVLLIISVYFFSALLKNAPEWRTAGTALYYAFSLDMIAYPTAKFLLHYPTLLRITTYLVAYMELIIPLGLLIPSNKIRGIIILLLVFFHLLIASTLFVGLFPLIGIVTLIGLTPSSIMDIVEKKSKAIFKKINTAKPAGSYQKERPFPSKYFSGFQKITDSILLFLILYSICWNITNLPFFPYKLNSGIKRIAYVLRFDQNWGMFAPTVFKDDGWFVYEGIRNDKKAIDIRQKGKVISYEKPGNEVFNYKNDRWRKYSENYLFIKNGPLRPPFCSYLLSNWNNTHPQQPIDSLSVIYFKEISVPDTQTPPASKEVLCTCKK